MTMMRIIGKSDSWRSLIEVHETKKELYLVFEFIEGVSLNTLIQRNLGEPMAWTTARKIIFPIIVGLQAIHNLGIVHRQIQPDNIIACSQQYRTKACIIDFKFACFEDFDNFFPKAGTPGFMAPELISEKHPRTSLK